MRRAVYCMEAFRRGSEGLERADLQLFSSATEAEEEARRQRPRRAGVLVYAVTGYPEAEVWDEPELLLAHGEAPAADID